MKIIHYACTAGFTLFLGLSIMGPVAAQTLTTAEPGGTKAVVGTCNSAKGCKALKRACLKAKGTYNDVNNGSSLKGTCSDKSTAKAKPTGSAKLAANTGPVEDAFCSTKSFCKVLKQTCSNSGGTYKPLGRNKGVCKD